MNDAERCERLVRRLAELGVRPAAPLARPEIVVEALTHSSHACEHGGRHNERLEMLGDAVLGFLVADMLFDLHPDAAEGWLTRLRATLVEEDALAVRARTLGLGELLALGRGEEQSGGRERTSLLADALEATVAAVYRSEGLDAADRLVRALFGEEAARPPAGTPQPADYKTSLQERAQARWKEAPQYRLVTSEGPDHARVFTVEVRLRGGAAGRGEGRTKKAAEQQAARAALERWSELAARAPEPTESPDPAPQAGDAAGAPGGE